MRPMKKFECVLFDLDGTLSESALGITKSVQYALREIGVDEPDLKKLECFIGPPLNDSFRDFYHVEDDATIQMLVDTYRERYAVKGIFECEMYEGVGQMLKDLHEAGIRLAVASSKPEEYVLRIMEYFQVAQYFDVVKGSGMNDERDRKDEKGTDNKERIVREALAGLRGEEDPEEFHKGCAMVGDRHFDIYGARNNGVTSIGVTYGYGSFEELREAGADYIVDTVSELEHLILGE